MSLTSVGRPVSAPRSFGSVAGECDRILESLGAAVIARGAVAEYDSRAIDTGMPTDPLEFADRVGTELSNLLVERARAELMDASQDAQFSAVLGASLLCVAEVLRNPVERGVPAARVAQIAASQIEALLNQIPPTDSP